MPDSRPSSDDCPSFEVLVGFDLGQLADEVFETVASHISRCDTCLAVIGDLQARSTANVLEQRVRDCLLAPELRETVTLSDAAQAPTEPDAGPSNDRAVVPDPWVGRMVGRYHVR
jgi:hypothetical protein